jgi:hypothetical protein
MYLAGASILNIANHLKIRVLNLRMQLQGYVKQSIRTEERQPFVSVVVENGISFALHRGKGLITWR